MRGAVQLQEHRTGLPVGGEGLGEALGRMPLLRRGDFVLGGTANRPAPGIGAAAVEPHTGHVEDGTVQAVVGFADHQRNLYHLRGCLVGQEPGALGGLTLCLVE
jgi:hypothetical protein